MKHFQKIEIYLNLDKKKISAKNEKSVVETRICLEWQDEELCVVVVQQHPDILRWVRHLLHIKLHITPSNTPCILDFTRIRGQYKSHLIRWVMGFVIPSLIFWYSPFPPLRHIRLVSSVTAIRLHYLYIGSGSLFYSIPIWLIVIGIKIYCQTPVQSDSTVQVSRTRSWLCFPLVTTTV